MSRIRQLVSSQFHFFKCVLFTQKDYFSTKLCYMLRLPFLLLFTVLSISAIAQKDADSITTYQSPSWILNGNIYEVNTRQYTPEGTFKAFEKHLPRLKAMGVQTLWFMPINPISKKDRKGALGSYYAIADYKGINPEYGTMADWKALVKKCHTLGFKVIIDWVANHTGADNKWLETHPDFYLRDSAGKAVVAYDWTDTRKLDYNNPTVTDTMINCMKYWIEQSDIDGFRCDVAGEVPAHFWKKCIAALHKQKHVFMLAEGDEPWLHQAGFDASYPWEYFSMSKKVADGTRPAFALDSVLQKMNASYPANYIKLFFTSNHDENSWNKADYGTMPGASHAPFAVLTQTLPHGVPLIYSGQEEPCLDSISFFYKDTIQFGKYARAGFYKTLLWLKASQPALQPQASFKKLQTSYDTAIYAFTRGDDKKKLIVVTNLSGKAQTFFFHPSTGSITGKYKNVFTGAKESLNDKAQYTLPAWGYKILLLSE